MGSDVPPHNLLLLSLYRVPAFVPTLYSLKRRALLDLRASVALRLSAVAWTSLALSLRALLGPCCWGARLVGRRFIRNTGGEFDTGIFLQIEFKGLAGYGRGTDSFLRKSIPGYQSNF